MKFIGNFPVYNLPVILLR